MSIDASIYARLNDTSITGTTADRIYNTDPNENTPWPFVLYPVTPTAPVVCLAGITSLTQYTVTVDVWARSAVQRGQLADAVTARLHCYRGGSVQLATLSDQAAQIIGDETEGDNYHGQQTYSGWASQ